MTSWTAALRDLPRDAVVVTPIAEVAGIAARAGRRVLLEGRDYHDWRDLRDNWSELTRRATVALAVGPPELSNQVARFCQVTHQNKVTSIARARRWAEHMIRNVLLLSERPHGMKVDALKGHPAFIVGAGPSLEKNGHLLAHAPGVVLTVNAASKAVRGTGVVSVESNDLSVKLDERGVQLLGLAAPPHVLRARYEWLRPVWCGEIAWVPEELTGVDRIPMSGSGATVAAGLAHRWGCNPIVLVGMDLAFTSGKLYADTTGHHDRVTETGQFQWGAESLRMVRVNNPLPDVVDVEHVRAWGGQGTVQTGGMFNGVRHFFTALADTLQRKGVTCINATEGGASIDGWSERKLVEIEGLGGAPGPSSVELAAACAGELVPRDQIVEWLRGEAPEQLAEAWAYGRIYNRVERHQQRAPSRIPLVEAWHVGQAVTDVESIVAEARVEIRRVVEELCSGPAG